MTMSRRTLLHLGAGAAALPASTRLVSAQAYPARSVRVIVPYPAGNASDIIGRLAAQALTDRLGQSFVTENRPGAGGNTGAETVARAAPDGYTLLLEVVTSYAINAAVDPKLSFNFARDFTPVASIGSGTYMLVINPSIPAKTLPEFIAYAKANAGKLNMASAGNGTATHVFGELFMMMTGVQMQHVPYRTSFIPDLLGSQVQVVFGPISQLLEYVRSDKLRALGVTAATREAHLPDVPSIGEVVPGYAAAGRYGLGAPRNTPAAVVNTINGAINEALASPALKSRFADLGIEPAPMTPAEFSKLIDDELDRWGKVVRAANIKAE